MYTVAEVGRKGESNDMKVLRRVMSPRCDGTYLVPEEVLESWRDTTNGGRESVLRMWSESSQDKDCNVAS